MGERVEVEQKQFTPDPKRFSVPIYRTLLRPGVEKRIAELREFAETTPLNKVEWLTGKDGVTAQKGSVGFITSSIAYQYVREVSPESSVFRLGITHPLPPNAIKEFCAAHEKIYIVEEGEPFIEDAIRAMGITKIVGKEIFGVIGEY